MVEELREAWRTNNRINLYLIDRISKEGLLCSLSKRGGRDVARQFAHIHNNRLYQLEKRARDLRVGLELFPTKVTPSKKELVQALKASSTAVEEMLQGILQGTPKRRGMRKGLFTTFAYFIAHESHHRGGILLTLKECGHKLSPKDTMAIWGWDQM